MARRSPAAIAITVAVVMGLTACTGSSSNVAGAPTAATSTAVVPTVSPCPAAPAPVSPHRPAHIPADLPKPPGAHIDDTSVDESGVHTTKFTTPTSLRESILFVVQRLPSAGYVLGRGDAEPTEADAPFIRNSIRGLVRLVFLQPCTTLWLLSTVDTSKTSKGPTILPSYSPSGSPSPLPFG